VRRGLRPRRQPDQLCVRPRCGGRHAAVTADPAYAGATVDVAGPDNITLNELAHLVARHEHAGAAGPGRVKHIGPTALRLMSVLARPASPALARQAAAALTMDTTDIPAARPSTGSSPSAGKCPECHV
jgi:hypothetical protein